MAPKGTNQKKESGRAKKAENEAKKRADEDVEKKGKEDLKWEEGARGAGASKMKEEKRKLQLERKAEIAKLLAEEEATLSIKPKISPKSPKSNKKFPAGPGAIAAGDGLGEQGSAEPQAEQEEADSFAATGIDNALDLLEVVTAKMDKASVGQQAAGIEKHPERRFKAAFEAYLEQELPKIKIEQPGLRLQQYKDLLYKQFQKSPDNPFNQVTVSYDATKEEKVDALKAKQAEVAERLRERP